MNVLEMLKNKSQGKLSNNAKNAKLSILKNISSMAGDSLLDRLKSPESMAKVTVAANDPSSLKKGLEKAEELIKQSNMGEESGDAYAEGDDEHEMPNGEMMANGEMSKDDIDAEIARLLEMKHKMSSRM